MGREAAELRYLELKMCCAKKYMRAYTRAESVFLRNDNWQKNME